MELEQNEEMKKAMRAALEIIDESEEQVVSETAASESFPVHILDAAARDKIQKLFEPFLKDDTGIERKEFPQSGNIASAEYEAAKNVVRIKFKNGGHYEYQDISKETWEKFLDNESAGKAFIEYIKPKAFVKLG